MVANILIVGLGLIGGSLGLALRGTPQVKKVNGFDTNPQTVQQALQIGAIDAGVELAVGAAQADVIIICAPLRFYAGIIEKIKPHLKPGCIVTDVGSTKQPVMQLFKYIPDNVFCVGGHPMAGAEIKGINGADR